MIVYVLGPARLFSESAYKVMQAGGTPIGAPLVAALTEPFGSIARHELLYRSDAVYAQPGWRDSATGPDDYLEALEQRKPIFYDPASLENFLMEEVAEAELEYLDVGPAGTRLLGSQLGLR